MFGKNCSWSNCKGKLTYKNLTWWLLLLIAVLAIPAFAIMLTSTVTASGGAEMVIFILACWLCIYFGLRLIKNSRITPILFEKVTLSDAAKQRCLNMTAMIESEIVKWKRRYEKCEPVFMNLSRQPAWDYLDEITAILSGIKQGVERDSTIPFPEMKALTAWVESSKPSVIEGYLHTLESIYGYSKAEFAQQGKNIDEIYPELGRGHMDTLTNAPNYAKNFAIELLNIVKSEHPMLAQADLKQVPIAKVG